MTGKTYDFYAVYPADISENGKAKLTLPAASAPGAISINGYDARTKGIRTAHPAT